MSPSPLTTTVAAPGVDLGLTLTAVRMGVGDPTWASDARGSWGWATRTPAGAVTLRASPTEAGIEVAAWGPGAEWLVPRAPGLLGALDPGPDEAPDHPVVADLLTRFAELRMARTARPLDAAVAAVCRRGVSAFEAGRSWALMVEAWGDDAPGPGALRLPPSPRRIADAAPYEMHVMGLEQERAAEIRRLASHAARLELAASEDGDGDEVAERIGALSGVADDVVDHVRSTAFGDPDAVPVVDAHVVAAVVRTLHDGSPGPAPPLADLLAPFAPQRGRVLRVLEAASAAGQPDPPADQPPAEG